METIGKRSNPILEVESPGEQAIYMIDRFWEGETVDGQPVSKVKYRTP